MVGLIKKTFNPPVLRIVDHWILLRAPLLWRTRILQILLLLGLAAYPFGYLFLYDIERPADIPYSVDSDLTTFWLFQLFVTLVILVLWVKHILRKPVGELPLYRHSITLLAVFVGSYLWLIAPSLFAYKDIRSIGKVGPDSKILIEDLALLSKYTRWRCIPKAVWQHDDKLLVDITKLLEAKRRLDYSLAQPLIVENDEKSTCDGMDTKALKERNLTGDSGSEGDFIKRFYGEKLILILDARHFPLENYSDKKYAEFRKAREPWVASYNREKIYLNQFSHIRSSFTILLYFALCIAVMTVILSYPRYVWRRRIIRR